MMASALLPLKIMETSRVAPPPGTTPGHASLPFTFLDVLWLIFPPVERLFFYPYHHSLTHFMSSLLPSLKQSLSHALTTYYPLAGGFRQKLGTDDLMEHYYVEGDAVSFTVAECGSPVFDDLASSSERDALQLDSLVPHMSKPNNKEELHPLLAVQVTVFPEQGIVIGTSVHHTACDGATLMQFMHTWAETCLLGVPVSLQVPIFDRSLISDPSNLYSILYNQVQDILKYSAKHAEQRPGQEPPDHVLTSFTFSQRHIQMLKQLISEKAEQRKSVFHCSTIVVVFAYVWTCFVRAKGIASSKRACMGIPADVRARIQPPIPAEYFGNCLALCLAPADVADLICDDGIFIAAEAIGKTVERSSERLKSARNWLQEYHAFAVVPVLTVAGSPKFKVYDVDFGFGRPIKVEIVSATKGGAMSVAESRDEKGGIEIGIGFPKYEMDRFKKYFFDGLERLSE